MTIYTKSGKIQFLSDTSDGIAFAEECCDCVKNPCVCESITTSDCAAEASMYFVTLDGITNDNCVNCNDYNGLHPLCYQTWSGYTDAWQSAASTATGCGHSSGDPLWVLYYDSANSRYTLQMVGPGIEWYLAEASWNCMQPNTLEIMAITPVPNQCNNLPATITIYPCLSTCTDCSGSPPYFLSVTLAGYSDARCTNCEAINDTFVLAADSACSWSGEFSFDCTSGGTGVLRFSVNIGQVGSDISITVLLIIDYTVPFGFIDETRVYYKALIEDVTEIDCDTSRSIPYWYYQILPPNPPAHCTNLPATTCQLN